MKIRSKKAALVNAVGALGYTGVLLSWTMLVVVAFLMVASGSLIVPVPVTSSQSNASYHVPIVLSIVLAVVAVVVMVILLAMLLVFVGKGGSWLIRKLLTVFHMTHTKTHIWLVKAVLDVLPMLCFSFLTYSGIQSELVVPLYVSVFLVSLVSLILFSVQYLLASRLKVASAKIW